MAEVDINGKKAAQRHLTCSCQREIVIHTSLKDEPNYDGDGSDKAKIFSFEELSERLGIDVVKQPQQPQPVVQTTKTIITSDTTPANVGISTFLTQDDAETLSEAVANYGRVFKPLEDQKQEQDKYLAVAERCKTEGLLIIDGVEEARMIRCALSDRNMKRLYPIDDYADEADHNVKRRTTIVALRDRFTRLFEDANV
jgi:hypothetical protein